MVCFGRHLVVPISSMEDLQVTMVSSHSFRCHSQTEFVMELSIVAICWDTCIGEFREQWFVGDLVLQFCCLQIIDAGLSCTRWPFAYFQVDCSWDCRQFQGHLLFNFPWAGSQDFVPYDNVQISPGKLSLSTNLNFNFCGLIPKWNFLWAHSQVRCCNVQMRPGKRSLNQVNQHTSGEGTLIPELLFIILKLCIVWDDRWFIPTLDNTNEDNVLCYLPIRKFH